MNSIKWRERIKRKIYNSVLVKLGIVRRLIEKINVIFVFKFVVLDGDKSL